MILERKLRTMGTMDDCCAVTGEFFGSKRQKYFGNELFRIFDESG